MNLLPLVTNFLGMHKIYRLVVDKKNIHSLSLVKKKRKKKC